MFHKPFFIFIIAVISCSCVTDSYIPAYESEIIAAPEPVPAETLYWCSPQIFEKQLDKKTPLPDVRLRKIRKPVKKDYSALSAVPIESEAATEVEAAVASEAEAAVASEAEAAVASEAEAPELESESFLEVILGSDEIEAAGKIKAENSEMAEAVKTSEIEAAVSLPEPEIAANADEEASDAALSNEEVEDVFAVVREVYLYECETEGWLLDGITDLQGASVDGLRFKGREYLGGNTIFSFYPYETGFYLINIRRSDYAAGIISRKTIRLEVNQNPAVEKAGDEIASDKTSVREASVPELSQQEPLVTLDEELPSFSDAVDDTAVDAVLSVSEIIAAADVLEAVNDCTGAVDLLNDSILSTEKEDLDVLYFKLGGLYESCSAVRDERTAVKFYKKIVDYYPVSNYWLEAKERIKYLERNYIFIR